MAKNYIPTFYTKLSTNLADLPASLLHAEGLPEFIDPKPPTETKPTN